MSDPVHIRLELRPDGDCLTGRAISDEGSREFHGWLGLMGAIEALYPLPVPAATDDATQRTAAAREATVTSRAACSARCW